jgi:hypothetical protein
MLYESMRMGMEPSMEFSLKLENGWNLSLRKIT